MAQAFRSTRVLTPHGLAPATLLAEMGASLPFWAGAKCRPTPGCATLAIRCCCRVLWIRTYTSTNRAARSGKAFETATQAAASGGVTTLVDMPLNCVPETTDEHALEAKRNAARGQAWVDWAAWGGVVRGNADELLPLAHAGVPGFKCFLIHSGIDGFAWVDEADLRLALGQLRGSGLPLLVHAELAGPVNAATESLNASQRGLAQVFHLPGFAAGRGRGGGDCPAHPPGRGV